MVTIIILREKSLKILSLIFNNCEAKVEVLMRRKTKTINFLLHDPKKIDYL